MFFTCHDINGRLLTRHLKKPLLRKEVIGLSCVRVMIKMYYTWFPSSFAALSAISPEILPPSFATFSAIIPEILPPSFPRSYRRHLLLSPPSVLRSYRRHSLLYPPSFPCPLLPSFLCPLLPSFLCPSVIPVSLSPSFPRPHRRHSLLYPPSFLRRQESIHQREGCRRLVVKA